jgi:hypothetical protein
MPTIGILAYGSLIEEPGPEIEAARLRTEPNVRTPFKIEFARKSRTRGYGPTLVPVAVGGDHVLAQIIVLKEGITEQEACDLVWRRETRQIGSSKRYVPSDPPGENTTAVKSAGSLRTSSHSPPKSLRGLPWRASARPSLAWTASHI